MGHSIWKFELRSTDEQMVAMPRGAKLLSVAEQYGNICLWALVDTQADKVPRGIAILGTGHPCMSPDDPFTFLGTVLLHGGQLVLHVFDAGEQPS